MEDPFKFRVNVDGPTRAEDFQAVLDRRKANAQDVLRALMDAYIESNGDTPFPVKLVPKDDGLEN
jgi:predicted TIM-barrel enzyme